MREILIHAHLPKCGGSTLNLILRNNFGRRFRGIYDLPIKKRFSSAEVRALIEKEPAISCFASHSFSLDLPFSDSGFALRAIAFVRNPVQRFLSHYFYHRNHTRLVPQARDLRLEDYISYALRDGNKPTYIDGQTLLLSGSADAAGLERIQRLLADKQLLLFPLEHFDRVCILLEKMFPDALRDCSYMRVRVSRKDQVPASRMIDAIRSFARHDNELWQMAHQHLGRLLPLHFGSVAAVEERVQAFQRRCRGALPRLFLLRAMRFLRRHAAARARA